jgi:imidazoleglycerol-phosphate dehydratase
MAAIEREGDARTGVRVTVDGSGTASVGTGVSVLDHLLGLLAVHGSFDLALEVAPGSVTLEASSAGRALGKALAEPLRHGRRIGSAVVPADEALAHVALEASGRPLLVSNVDLTEARVAGLDTDIVARFLEGLAEGAELTLHVRLLEGRDTQHVLDSIFKALGVALAQACRPRGGKEK